MSGPHLSPFSCESTACGTCDCSTCRILRLAFCLCLLYVLQNDPNPTMERFYLVVVQYAARLSSQKISAAVMRLKPATGARGDRVTKGRCSLQVAPEEVRVRG